MQKMRIPEYLIEEIKQDANKNHRSATKQLEVVLCEIYGKKQDKDIEK